MHDRLPIDHRMEGYFAQATMDLYQQLYLKAGSATMAPRPSATRRCVTGSEHRRSLAVHQRDRQPEQQPDLRKARASYGEVGTEPAPYLTTVTYVAGGEFTDPYGVAIGASEGGIGGLYTSTVLRRKTPPERTRSLSWH